MGLWLRKRKKNSTKLKEAAARAKAEIEGRAEQDHKKLFFEVLRGLEKNISTSV